MKRNKKVEVRLTEQELSDLKYGANSKGMSISYYIREAVKGNSSDVDKRKIAMHIFNMQTYLNGVYQTDMTEETLSLLTKEMNSLWQYLN